MEVALGERKLNRAARQLRCQREDGGDHLHAAALVLAGKSIRSCWTPWSAIGRYRVAFEPRSDRLIDLCFGGWTFQPGQASRSRSCGLTSGLIRLLDDRVEGVVGLRGGIFGYPGADAGVAAPAPGRRRMTLDPVEHGRGIHIDATLGQELGNIRIGYPILDILPHGKGDNAVGEAIPPAEGERVSWRRLHPAQ